jgi:hypothetical protein
LGNRLIVAKLSAVMLAGCAASRRYEASRPEKVEVTEAMLSAAGFRTIKVDPSEHQRNRPNIDNFYLEKRQSARETLELE